MGMNAPIGYRQPRYRYDRMAACFQVAYRLLDSPIQEWLVIRDLLAF